ncbi:MAG TPA: hypothetical protein VKA32_02765, partial [Gammaproteobacteria bacterium]|nr:hypothetical protein [Gammaproteobacteria bacterium]
YRLPRIDGSRKYRVMVSGRYTTQGGPCRFRAKSFVVPRRLEDPATIATETGALHKQDPATAMYPPAPPSVDEEPNAESPILIPLGPERTLFPPTPAPTGTAGAGAPLEVTENTSINSAGVPPDPSTARGSGDVVLATYNTGISYSLDGGASFTDVNLVGPEPGNPSRTSFFPQSDNGLCCDQVVIYIPEQDLFVWLLQYWPVVNSTTNTITQPNRLRIAWATPDDIRDDFWNAWTYGDLTATSVSGVSDGLGVAGNEWLDYPDLAYSGSYLYVAIDHGATTPGLVYTGRRIVARLDLGDIADPSAGVVHYGYTELSGASGLNKSHFVQGAPGRMVTAGLKDTSTLRVFSWDDDRSSVTTSAMPVSSITRNYNSVAPDGTDWYSVSFPGNVTGGTYRADTDEYLFAFDGGQDAGNGRPQAYVRIESAKRIPLPFLSIYFPSAEYDVWNANYAFAMAALGTQAGEQGAEVGMSLAVGGGTLGYPQFAVGYKGDFAVTQVTGSNATQGGRFGDYLPLRPVPVSRNFATEVYDVLAISGGGARATMRYVEFGRPGVIVK